MYQCILRWTTANHDLTSNMVTILKQSIYIHPYSDSLGKHQISCGTIICDKTFVIVITRQRHCKDTLLHGLRYIYIIRNFNVYYDSCLYER